MKIVERNVRRTALLLGAGAFLLATLVAGATYLSFRSAETFRQVTEERSLRQSASDLLSALQDAEVGHRGYILTRDEAFLAPYTLARERLPGLRDELGIALGRSPEDARIALAALDPQIERRLATIDRTIAGARDGTLSRESAVAMEAEGKAAMDAARSTLGGLIERSDARFEALIATQDRLTGWLQLAAILAGVATLAVVGLAFVTLTRQLRALRLADLELRRLNADLEERVRSRTQGLVRANQEVQRFAYIVTHDLRAPLVNVMGFTSELEASLTALQAYVLAEGEVSEPVVREARQAAAEDLPEAIGFIRASTRKMDGLINAILRISRDGRRELRPERLDLADMAAQALDAVAHQIAEAGGAARVEGSLAIVSDRLSVEQALGNLIDNAVKYRAPGRPLDLVVRLRPDGPAAARLEVEDNGRGIGEADRERVFELFRRAGRPDAPGEGIGLAHVRSLVRNLGGEVTLRSREGEGSVFVLELPSDLRQVREAAS